MTRLPIRIRVTAACALAMATVLAGAGWLLYSRLDSHLALALDRQLQLRSQDLAALVRQPHASLAADGRGRFIEQGESYAQLLDSRGHVLEATKPLGRRSLLDLRELRAAAAHPLYGNRSAVPGLNEPSRLLATPLALAGRKRVLVVGATSQNDAETLASFRDELLIAGPIALLLASLVGYLLAGLALRQVESMRRRAAAISAETAGERLPVPRTADELQRLGRTLNEMLDRLESALQRERDFVADAGHELRTPLALLRTELELALRHGESPAELREAIQAASGEVDRLAALAEDLLLIARADRGKLPLKVETIDGGRLLETVAARFAWRAEHAGRSLTHCNGAGVRIRGDSLRLEQALGNLVDNALRHGEGRVSLELARIEGQIELHVRDQGPGFPPHFIPHAFERFTQSQRAPHGAGGGLGLSIVRAIANAHAGEAHAANPPAGGADVWLLLPDRAL